MKLGSGMLTKIAAARNVNLAGGARFIITFSSETPFKGLFYMDIEDFWVDLKKTNLE